jgi:hypothetical protein
MFDMPGISLIMLFIMSLICSQHILPDIAGGMFGAMVAPGPGTFAGLDVSVSAPEEPAHDPAKKAANAMHAPPNTPAANFLRSRIPAPTLLKMPISSPFDER